jgi:hypothetical protein
MFVDKWCNVGVGHGVGVRHVEMRRRPVVGGNNLREGRGMRGMTRSDELQNQPQVM